MLLLRVPLALKLSILNFDIKFEIHFFNVHSSLGQFKINIGGGIAAPLFLDVVMILLGCQLEQITA